MKRLALIILAAFKRPHRRAPEVFVVDPDGERHPLARRGDGYLLQLPLTKAGRYTIEAGAASGRSGMGLGARLEATAPPPPPLKQKSPASRS